MKRLIKKAVPKKIRETILKGRSRLREYTTLVERQNKYDNIFHCCVQKTASQWLRRILSDRIVYKYSGLKWTYYPTWEDKSTQYAIVRDGPKQFDKNTVVSPLYIDCENFKSIGKTGNYKVLFVKRDPRDIVVSYYFSVLNSHLSGDMMNQESKIKNLPKQEGLKKSIDLLNKFLFPSLESWHKNHKLGNRLVIARYEELTDESENYSNLRNILEEMDIIIPKSKFSKLMEKYKFKKLAGRSKGKEKKSSQFRKGIKNDWKNHFDNEVLSYFEEETNDINVRVGYE